MPTTTENAFLRGRVNMPTAKGSAELAELPAQIRARSFFSARVAEAHILEKFRQVSDAYSEGKIGRDEARAILRVFARENGKDDGSASIKNLASTARLHLILDQNRAMAKAAGDYARMYKPANLKVFPYVRYVASVGSKNPRDSHQKYNGNIYDKRDPWLKTHWPPWDFGCKCQLENVTAEERDEVAKSKPEKIQAMSPPEAGETVDTDSGFSFNPEHAFDNAADLGNLTPISRARILDDAEEAVKDGKLGTCGVIVAPPETGNPPAEIPNIGEVKQAFDGMKDAARESMRDVGLDPDNLPGYNKVNKAFVNAKTDPYKIPEKVLNSFPETGIEVCTVNQRAAEAAGIPPCPVVLERGNDNSGLAHLWRNHKDVFANPEKAVRLLRETLGNPNCRVVLQLEPYRKKGKSHCRKRLVIHNPGNRTYCVMLYTDGKLRLVSWHNAKDDYGNRKWPLK
jgi:hypothetical protein